MHGEKGRFLYFSNAIQSVIQYTELTFQYNLEISLPYLALLSVLKGLTPLPRYSMWELGTDK